MSSTEENNENTEAENNDSSHDDDTVPSCQATFACDESKASDLFVGKGSAMTDTTRGSMGVKPAKKQRKKKGGKEMSDQTMDMSWSERAAEYAMENDDMEKYAGDEYDSKMDDIEPLPTDSRPTRRRPTQPGAYATTEGRRSTRRQRCKLSPVRTRPTALVSTSSEFSPPDLVGGVTQAVSGQVLVVEARPVLEDIVAPALESATPFDIDALPPRRDAAKEWRQLRIFGLLISFLVCSAVAITVGLVQRKTSSSNPLRNNAATTKPPITVVSTDPPTVAPTGPLELLRQGLPHHTLENLKDISTPQWQAYDWLSRHPDLLGMPEWRKTQLFAVGSFYYAMEGDLWRDEIKSRWMQYTTDECLWFNSEFGDFVQDGQQHEHWAEDLDRAGTRPCTPRGEIQSICVAQLHIEEEQDDDPSVFPYVPPEIAMLTSLALLGPCENDIHGSFFDILPTVFFEMKSMKKLNLINNALTGAIPSQLGLMTSLTFLNAQENEITGTLPSDFFLLTNLKELYLQENALTGPIPSQLGLMTSLSFLDLSNNKFTGTIPKELSQIPSMAQLLLHSNLLTGAIPDWSMAANLTALSVGANALSGVFSDELCELHPFVWDNMTGLGFNCAQELCGCDWCPCAAHGGGDDGPMGHGTEGYLFP